MSINVVTLKKDMVRHAKKCGEEIPHINVESSVWGVGARRLAYRITKEHLKKPSTSKDVVHRFLNPVPDLNIINVDWDWAQPLTTRVGPPGGVVWHHAAATVLSPTAIHSEYINNRGYSGIGYHFYVRKDGKCFRGRPENKLGAHARGHNEKIGVCAEGNYVHEAMPKAQLDTLKALHFYLHHKYKATDYKHSDVNATACPGVRYPFSEIIACK